MSRPAARSLQCLLSLRGAAAGENVLGRRELASVAAASAQQATWSSSAASTSSSSLLFSNLLRRHACSSSRSSSSSFSSVSRLKATTTTTRRRSHRDSAFSVALQQQQQQLQRGQSSFASSSSSSSSSSPTGAAGEAASEERVVPEAEAEAAGAGATEEGELESPEALRAALDETAALLATSEASTLELRDRLARSAADMENLRSRTARQAEQAKAFAVQSLVKNLLDVADNLSRAREAASGGKEESDPSSAPERLASLVQGVELTEKVLLSAFRSAGVEPFEPRGEAFDPNEMEAMFEVPLSSAAAASAAGSSEGEEEPSPGHVAVVTKKGYKLNGRVVRPAQVGVFKG